MFRFVFGVHGLPQTGDSMIPTSAIHGIVLGMVDRKSGYNDDHAYGIEDLDAWKDRVLLLSKDLGLSMQETSYLFRVAAGEASGDVPWDGNRVEVKR